MVKGTMIMVAVPPQAQGTFLLALLSLAGSSASATSYAFFGVNILLNVLVSGLISLLWGVLNNLSSITILFLIGVPISGSA